MTPEEIETALNELITEAVKGGGHVYVVDRKRNTFALKLTEAIKISYYGGYQNGGEQ